MLTFLSRAAAAAGVILRDLAALAGAASVAYGAWLAWPPAGFIAGGLLAMAGAWLLARSGGAA